MGIIGMAGKFGQHHTLAHLYEGLLLLPPLLLVHVDGSAEVKTTTRLAGAEKPREALEAMLEERRALRTRVVAGVGSREHARRNAPAERVEDVVRGMRHLESPRGEAGATS